MKQFIARSLATLLVCGVPSNGFAQHDSSMLVQGEVFDRRTGRPLSGVLVHVEHQSVFAETDTDGRFTFTLPPGTHTLYVSMVGYVMTRQAISGTAAETVPVRIELAEGAGAYSEEVTVRGSAISDAAATQRVLHGRDLLSLRGVMLDDPLRALQALPSATATDDFYSEFAVRGSTFRHVGLTVDGIPSRYLMHTVHGVTDAGSIAMINAETLGAASLLPGSYAQRTGRTLGAQVDLTMREGNRERFHGRAGLSGTSATFLAEGPLASGRGSWLASVRRSYLDFLIERIDPDADFAFGFTDAQAKLVFDANERNQFQVTTLVGRAKFEEDGDLADNDEANAIGVSWLAALGWRYTPGPRLAIMQRLFGTGVRFDNTNRSGIVLDAGRSTDFGWRADGSFAPRAGSLIEFGGDVVALAARRDMRRRLDNAVQYSLLNTYDHDARTASGYARIQQSVGSWLTISPGIRADYWGARGETSASPWMNVEARVAPNTSLRAGTGIYRQIPTLDHLYGIRRADDLEPERALHVDAGVEHLLARDVRLQVTVYARRERDVIWAPGAEPRRLSDGRIAVGSGDAPWMNDLAGEARGVEFMIRRDAPDRLSGWAGYAFGRHRYTSASTGDTFLADADQRHTLSLYARYGLSHRTSLSMKYRYGSNFPVVGYLREQPFSDAAPPLFGGFRPLLIGLGEERNRLRLPAYSRLDFRADRTFVRARSRVTLFAEVANLLNRTNYRNTPYGFDPSGRVSGERDSLIPIVPSAGFTVEF